MTDAPALAAATNPPMADSVIVEELRRLEAFPDYEVSCLGRIRSLARVVQTKNGRSKSLPLLVMKTFQNPENRYMYVRVVVNKESCSKSLHRLIAKAFIPNPENKPCVDHINRNRQDNRACNLRWCTYRENNENKRTDLTTAISGHRNITTRLLVSGETSYKLRYIRDGIVTNATFETLEDALDARSRLLGY
jgi:hypothetical protein